MMPKSRVPSAGKDWRLQSDFGFHVISIRDAARLAVGSRNLLEGHENTSGSDSHLGGELGMVQTVKRARNNRNRTKPKGDVDMTGDEVARMTTELSRIASALERLAETMEKKNSWDQLNGR